MSNKFKTQSIFNNNAKVLKDYYGSLENLDEVLRTNDHKAEIILFRETLRTILFKNKSLAKSAINNIDTFSFLVKLILFYMETDHYEMYDKPFCGRKFIKNGRSWQSDLKIIHLPIAIDRYNAYAYPSTGYFNYNVKDQTLLFEQFISLDTIRYFDGFVNKDGYKNRDDLYLIMAPHFVYHTTLLRNYMDGYNIKPVRKKFNLIANLRKLHTKSGIEKLIDNYTDDSVYRAAKNKEVIDIKNSLYRTKKESIKSLL